MNREGNMSERTWSPQQIAIFEWFRTGRGHLIVDAKAGTGKTTTILEGVKYAPEESILFAAFNNRIAKEADRKNDDPRVTVLTSNSLGWRALCRAWKGVRLNKDRGLNIALKVAGHQAPDQIVGLVAKLASAGKNECFNATVEDLIDLAGKRRIEPDASWSADGWDVQTIAKLAHQAMAQALSREDGEADFDDQLYLPVKLGLMRPEYQLVVIDEGQDQNKTQIALARMALSKSGRLCVVGDPRQAIYSFRGADTAALHRIGRETQATVLGLDTTYRCAALIVAEAQQFVPGYKAAPNAPAGEVFELGLEQMIASVKPGEAIISRKNAPLMGICLKLLKSGVRARIEGRDIGRSLIGLAKKIAGKSHLSIVDFLKRLEAWKARELAKAQAKRSESAKEEAAELVTDQYECMIALADGLAGIGEMIKRIESLFADTDPDQPDRVPMVVLTSCHKAKGLEWHTVYMLCSTFSASCKKGSEEENLKYVAITRAMRRLGYVGTYRKGRNQAE